MTKPFAFVSDFVQFAQLHPKIVESCDHFSALDAPIEADQHFFQQLFRYQGAEDPLVVGP